MIICPKCGSKKIFSFRLDSDWGRGGDYEPANFDIYTGEKEESIIYTKEELNYDGFNRPDFFFWHCGDCNKIFDER